MTITKSRKYSFFILLSTIIYSQTSLGMGNTDELVKNKQYIAQALSSNNCLDAMSALLPQEIHSGSLINFLHGIRVVRSKSPDLLRDGADFKKALTKYYHSFFDTTQKPLIEDYSNNYHAIAELKKEIEKDENNVTKYTWRARLCHIAQLGIVGSFLYFSKSAENFFLSSSALCFTQELRYRSLTKISQFKESLEQKEEEFLKRNGDIIMKFDDYKDELPTLGFVMPQQPSLPKP